MQYHAPTQQFTIDQRALWGVALHLRYAIKKARSMAGLPATPFKHAGPVNGPEGDAYHVEAALLDIAQEIGIDMGANRPGMLDVSDARARNHRMPERIQLRRAKGWTMPPNTVKVDCTTKWGNPFVVGKDGTQADCVYLYRMLARGLLCMTTRGNRDAQVAARKAMERARDELRGKNLACWCKPGAPCHADVLLELANAQIQRAP